MALNFIGTSLRLIGIFEKMAALSGVTEALAAQEIYELGQEVQPFSIALGTLYWPCPVCEKIAELLVIFTKSF